MEHVEHGRAGQPHHEAGGEEPQGDAGQHDVPPRARTEGGEPRHCVGEHEDREQAGEEREASRRPRSAAPRATTSSQPSRPHRGENARGHADGRGEDQREQREPQRPRQGLADECAHFAPQVVGAAEVAAQDSADVHGELDGERLVQAELGPDARDGFRARLQARP